MEKSTIVKNKLTKLLNENKMQALFLKEDSDAYLILDLETMEYRGCYLSFDYEGNMIRINTAKGSVSVYGKDYYKENLDLLILKSIDLIAISHLNFNKLDDDYVEDLEESIKAEIEELENQKSKEISDRVKEFLKDVHENNYQKDFISDSIKHFKYEEKKDGFNLQRRFGGSKIKYSSAKAKLSIKNHQSYKEKFAPKDIVSDFNESLFNEIIKEYFHKKKYEELRTNLDDGLAENISFYNTTESDFADMDDNF